MEKKVKSESAHQIIKTEVIESKLALIRNQQVIADADVAALYGVDTRRINEAVNNNPDKFPSVQDALGQKYYAFVQEHPEFKADVIMPNLNENLDYSRITNVSVTANPDKAKSSIIICTIDGESQKPREITGVQAQRMWLVDDKDMYKLRLAAILFEDKLGISEGQAAAQFRDNDEGQSLDNAQEASEQEEQQEQKTRRGGFHR